MDERSAPVTKEQEAMIEEKGQTESGGEGAAGGEGASGGAGPAGAESGAGQGGGVSGAGSGGGAADGGGEAGGGAGDADGGGGEAVAVSRDALDGRLDERVDTLIDGEPLVYDGMNWFVLRVASNKEGYVRDTLLRKIEIEGLKHLVNRILMPTEKTKTVKGGKQKITETKLYPGYVFVEMALEEDGRIPQDVFFLIKETTGVGDFVGATGRPTPLAMHEVEKMLMDSRKPEELPEIKMTFEKGEAVKIKEGPFENYEGTVDELLPEKGLVRVLVTIFGRQAPIELEEWQISKLDEE